MAGNEYWVYANHTPKCSYEHIGKHHVGYFVELNEAMAWVAEKARNGFSVEVLPGTRENVKGWLTINEMSAHLAALGGQYTATTGNDHEDDGV